MDESTLRIYLRRVLAVPAGASRKVLRSARDRRSGLWREKLLAAPASEKQLFEQRLAITNTAYDVLSDAVRFRTFYTRLEAGEEVLPELELLLAGLGESSPKPLPARVVEKRLAAVHERMQRTQTLIESAIREAVDNEAKRLQEQSVPDADEFYDAVYACGIAAGTRVKEDEIANSGKNKILDENCLAELDATITDTSEMAAHKAYDKLEAKVATSTAEEATPANRSTALALSLIILVLVFGAAYFTLSRDPSSFLAAPAPVVTLTEAEALACESPQDAKILASPDQKIAGGAGLIATAGAAGLAGSINNDTEDGQISYHEGIQAAISGDTTQALADFDKAYQANANLKVALYNKGNLLALTGRPVEAIASYSEFLKFKPNLAQAYYNRGLAHQTLALQAVSNQSDENRRATAGQELQKAIANYNCCLKINPRCAQAYYNRGFAGYCLGQFEQALSDFEKAQSLLPILEAANFNKNAVAAQLHRPVEPIAKVPPTAPIGPVGPPGS